MAIDERKIKILQAIINDYIVTGEPVGSRTIAKKYDLGVGSATIRNGRFGGNGIFRTTSHISR